MSCFKCSVILGFQLIRRCDGYAYISLALCSFLLVVDNTIILTTVVILFMCLLCIYFFVSDTYTESISKVRAVQIPGQSAGNFLLCPPTFSRCLITGHHRKVQGTVTRTELGRKWPTVYESKAIFGFSRSRCVKVPEDRA